MHKQGTLIALCCLLLKNSSVWFYSSSGFWSLKWCLVCFLTHGMGVKSNEVLVGYSNKPGVSIFFSMSYRQDSITDQICYGWGIDISFLVACRISHSKLSSQTIFRLPTCT